MLCFFACWADCTTAPDFDTLAAAALLEVTDDVTDRGEVDDRCSFSCCVPDFTLVGFEDPALAAPFDDADGSELRAVGFCPGAITPLLAEAGCVGFTEATDGFDFLFRSCLDGPIASVVDGLTDAVFLWVVEEAERKGGLSEFRLRPFIVDIATGIFAVPALVAVAAKQDGGAAADTLGAVITPGSTGSTMIGPTTAT